MIELSRGSAAAILEQLEVAEDELRALRAPDVGAVPIDPGVRLLRLRDAERSLQEARNDLERALADQEHENDATAKELRVRTTELSSARTELGSLSAFLQTAVRTADVGPWSWDLSTAGTARIEIGVEGEGREAALFVRDDGAGFDAAYAGQLFKPFSRLHGPGEFPGTGIGLAIVDRIVRRHGGHVEGSGAPGEGATFRFRLESEAVA